MANLGQRWSDLTRNALPFVNAPRNEDLIVPIRERQRQLISLSPVELRESSDAARALVHHEGVDAIDARIGSFALMSESLRRARGVELYDVQLLTSLVLAKGGIAEMQTGEGKTYACAPAAYLHALTGRGVHIATPNSYLAQRDYELLQPAYVLLGIQVGLLPEQASAAEKRPAYRCDVTYGTGHEFGFDYLRDQLSLRQVSCRALGAGLRQHLVGGRPTTEPLIQRGLYYSIVDEADNVLLDDAASPLILSGASADEAADAEVHRAAARMARTLRAGEHYRVTPSSGGVQLTKAGTAWIHRAELELPIDQLRRMWSEYVEQALHAGLLRRDVHYVVDDEGAVQIVDTSTGRIFTDRTWRDGLHQAVEAMEGVTVTDEKHALAQITRQRFSRLYERLAGMTGTATGCEREFRQVYRLKVQPIPLRTASQRRIWPARFFVTQQAKWLAIADSVGTIHQDGRPVLVGTRSIADSERLADLFHQRGITFQLLNGRQDAAEAAVVAQAGHVDAVTIATSLAGRGTDIALGPGVAELGGLHVVVSECDDSTRIDRQLIGRCARQGDPGSAQVFVSAEDTVIAKNGPWLADSIQRHAGMEGELPVDLMPKVRRIQRSAERLAYGARAAMLRRDLSRDSLNSSQPLD